MVDRDAHAAREVLAQRCTAQLLSGAPAATAVDVVDRLLAVQAQDGRAARLAIRVRTSGVTVHDVERAMTLDRSLVITWLNRGTLHLVRAEDYWWLQALTTPQLATSNARRLAQEGVSSDQAQRGVAVIGSALASEGPLTRGALRERLVSADVPVAGQALVHLLMRASLEGLVVRGPMVDGEQGFVLVEDWLGRPPDPRPREELLADLARRYLLGHAPASDADLAKWAGITLGDARRGLAQLGSRVQVDEQGNVSLRQPGQTALAHERALPPPRLLGAFDPLLMGWRSRTFVLPVDGGVVTSNGIFRAVALVNGIGVATWGLASGRVTIGEPFGPLTSADRDVLDRDAEDVVNFLA